MSAMELFYTIAILFTAGPALGVAMAILWERLVWKKKTKSALMQR